MAAPALCKFNQVGFCKFKSSCRNVHIVEMCPRKECVDKSCSLRHPQRCRYYAYFGHCKFGEKCAYLHYSLNQDLETKLISMKEAFREVTNTLVKTTDMQQLKMDVFSDEFTEYAKAVDEVEGKVRDIETELDFTVKERSPKLEKFIRYIISTTVAHFPRPVNVNAYPKLPLLPTPPSSAKKKNQH